MIKLSMKEEIRMSTDNKAFGAQLRALREAKGLSLRNVEAKSEKSISNPYLSQLENGKIQNPSPHILHKLAGLYAVPYEMLMESAGYLSRQNMSKDARTLNGAALCNLDDLSPEEEADVIKYIGFLRAKRR
jgi:transcriptional regulator with XRE-family HTH domain